MSTTPTPRFSAVLRSIGSTDALRGYHHAINELIELCYSELRLSFNRSAVRRCRIHLVSRSLTPGAVNLRLGAVQRLAYEAVDCGIRGADLASEIRRTKGVKKLGVPLGN